MRPAEEDRTEPKADSREGNVWELVRSLAEGKLVLVLGGELGAPGQECPGELLVRELGKKLGVPTQGQGLLPLASRYAEERDRGELLRMMGEAYAAAETPLIYQALAELPFRFVLTTEPDRRLEEAFRRAGHRVRAGAELEEMDLSDLGPSEVVLLYLFGTLDKPATLSVTEEEIEERLRGFWRTPEEFQAALALSQVLLLGFPFERTETCRLMSVLLENRPPNPARTLVVGPKLGKGAGKTLPTRSVTQIALPEAAFVESLTALWREHGARREPSIPVQSRPRRARPELDRGPYKFLEHFQEEDEDIFFGREEETRALFNLIIAHRLVVVHAPSGTGKTSLLHAGIFPRLKRQGYRARVLRIAAEPQAELVACIAAHEAEAPDQPLVVILDQFEEFFLRFPKEAREPFEKTLGELLREQRLDVRVVLSMRHEIYSNLYEFKPWLPTVFHHDFNLENLTPEGMAKAMEAPARLAGLTYEEGLVPQILAELGLVGSEATHLQVVCERLFRELPPGGKEFTKDLYARLGGAKGILKSYLERFISSLPQQRQVMGRQILKVLVSSTGIKNLCSAEDIAKETGRTLGDVRSMLDTLLEARLVRRLSGEEVDIFELGHDFLIETIGRWIESGERDLKKARELLQQEFANYTQYGLLMIPARARIIKSLEEELNLTAAERALLYQSLSSHTRKRVRIALLLVANLLLLAGLSFAVIRQAKLSLCRGAESYLSGIWDGPKKEAIRAAFLSTRLPFAARAWEEVEQALGAHAQAWAAMWTASCRATRVEKVQSEELLDQRSLCLKRNLEELRALSEVLARADGPIVEHWILRSSNKEDSNKEDRLPEAASGVAECSDAGGLYFGVKPPRDQRLRKGVDAVRLQIANLKAAFDTGRYQKGLTIARQAIAEARGLDYKPILAETQYWQGILLDMVGDAKASKESLDAAIVYAAESGFSDLEIKAAIRLMHLVGVQEAHFEEGLGLGRRVQAIIKNQSRRLVPGAYSPYPAQLHQLLGAIYAGKGSYELAIAHGKQAIELQEKAPKGSLPLLARSYVHLGSWYKRQGNHQKTLESYHQALALQEQSLGKEHPEVCTTLNALGNALLDQGEYKSAQEMHERALAMRLRLFGEEHTEVAASYTNLAGVLLERGATEQAFQIYQKALAIRTKVLGPEHQDVAVLINALGNVYFFLRDYPRALESYHQALALLEKHHGPGHAQVATTKLNLGKVYQQMGRTDEAIRAFSEALSIRESFFGPEHRETANCLLSLGDAYLDAGSFDRAEGLFERALSIRKRVLGADHRDVADAENSLGDLWDRKKDYQAAIRAYGAALEKLQKKLGPDHPEVAQSYINLGKMHLKQERLETAEQMFARALEIYEKRFDKEHPRLSLPLGYLGKIELRRKLPGRAIAIFARALSIQEKARAQDDLDLADALNNLGTAYFEDGKFDQAALYFNRALTSRQRKLSPKHPELATSLNNLGMTLLNLKRPDEAAAEFLRALEVLEASYPPDHPELEPYLGNLGRALAQSHRFEQAIPHFERGLGIREKQRGLDSPELIPLLINLGNSYLEVSRNADAVDAFRRALALSEKGPKPDPQASNTILSWLASAFQRSGQYDAAAEALRRSIAILEERSPRGLDSPELGAIYIRLGHLQRIAKLPEEAERSFLQALQLAEKGNGGDHPEVLPPLIQLAHFYLAQASFAQARAAYERILALQKQTLGSDHPEVIETLKNLGNARIGQREYQGALDAYQQVVAKITATRGPGHRDLGPGYVQLGRIYQKLGELDQAIVFFEKAVLLYEKTLGKESPETISSLNLWGMAHKAAANQEKALEILLRAKAALARSRSPSGSSLAATHQNLGRIYFARGELQKAAAEFELAGELFAKAFGPNHPEAIACLLNLGNIRSAQQDYGQAVEILSQALSLQSAAGNADSLTLQETLTLLGRAYQGEQSYAQAIRTFERALLLREQSVGPHHLELVPLLLYLGNASVGAARRGDAERYYERALAIQEKSLGPEHPDLVDTLNRLGRISYAGRDCQRALGLYRRSLSILEARPKESEGELESTLSYLGRVAGCAKETERAIEFLKRVLALQLRVHGASHPRVADTLFQLGETERNRGNLDQALSYHQEALATRELALGKDHPRVAYSLILISGILFRKSDYPQAVECLRRALSICDSNRCAASYLPETYFSFARVLWPQARYRSYAVELAGKARDLYAPLPGKKDRYDEVIEWLRGHSAEPDLP